MGILSGEATMLISFFLYFQVGSILIDKNLLSWEQFFYFNPNALKLYTILAFLSAKGLRVDLN